MNKNQYHNLNGNIYQINYLIIKDDAECTGIDDSMIIVARNEIEAIKIYQSYLNPDVIPYIMDKSNLIEFKSLKLLHTGTDSIEKVLVSNDVINKSLTPIWNF